MAIVKLNYVERGGQAKYKAKATIHYNQQRPGKHGEKLYRELFGADGILTREQALRMIDEAPEKTLFYRMVISPDPDKEDSGRDLDLRELTIQTMLKLEERLKTKIHFAAVVHADHRPHRHLHVLALLNRKLSQKDLFELRQTATRISQTQRQFRDLTSDKSLAVKHTLKLEPDTARKPISRGVKSAKRSAGPAPAPANRLVSCPRGCGGYAQTMERLSSKIQRCGSCGIIVRRIGLELKIEQRELSLGN